MSQLTRSHGKNAGEMTIERLNCRAINYDGDGGGGGGDGGGIFRGTPIAHIHAFHYI